MKLEIDELTIVSTYLDKSGAGIAASRWKEALGIKNAFSIRSSLIQETKQY
jgi:hypothetical protein